MDIAIIGGGAAAVALLDALAAKPGPTAEPRRTITVFEPSPHLWRGRAYGPDLDSVLVNAPPAIMSIRGGDFGHYAAWLGGERTAVHLDDLLGQPLVPRALYGDYLAHAAEKAVATLGEHGWQVDVVRARVTDVERSGDSPGARLTLRTEDACRHSATHLVLCVGGGTPPDLYDLADGGPDFIADPFPLAKTLDPIAPTSEVALIGAGLTAVDTAVSLAARGHTGPITLLSRSGVLPHVWQRPSSGRPRHVTAERVAALHKAHGGVTLADLISLLRAELNDHGEDFDDLVMALRATATDDPVRRLRHQIAAIDDPRTGRRVVQETAHSVGPYAWRLLPEADRTWLRRHMRTAVSVASPMVPVNATTLMALLDSGQLSLVAGLQAIERTHAGFRIRTRNGELITPTLVNAVNPAPQAVPATARQLVRSLAHSGLATWHPSGGLVPADPRVQIVGDLAGGGSFITSSIPGVAAQATHAARALQAPHALPVPHD